MNTNIPRGNKTESPVLQKIKEAHIQEIQQITQTLAQITNLSEETVKSHLDAMLEELVKPQYRPFYETATPEEWVKALREWSDSHRRDTPLLSDYAVSRAGIYEENEEV